ncbi:D-alanine--D-alanine ligase family protein [Paenibacillus sp. y28]|uniref:D-alanine--D-alanine ligase family protein n=1 Tax=Paenibacillus sp. y28 TaxID=3129110 RepID=UPI003018A628
MSRKIRVGLVYGGKSGEHDVSLSTALAVIGAFDHAKYDIHPFYIDKQGAWFSGPPLTGPVERKEELQFGSGQDAEPAVLALAPIFGSGRSGGLPAAADAASGAAADGEKAVLHSTGSASLARTEGAAYGVGGLDVVFPLLHGTNGEDGTIQGLLEMANVPYVGAGVLASAVGMDKVAMKKLFAQEGLPQCHYQHFTNKQWAKDRAYFLMEIEISLGYPCFVKPANLGSSVGVGKARNQEELIAAVEEAFRFDRKVIVEEFIHAREVEVSVLGNDEPIASVPGEIVSSNEFYDYKAKYIDGKSAMVIPAELSEETADRLRELAVQAFLAIDGSGLSRVDFFISRDNGQIYLNEINTMPGFTPFSMYPLLWKETGKPYQELLDDLIRLALERHAEKQKLNFTFDA